jgi:hypothetical protein
VKYKHILFILNYKIWNGKKPIISILGNNEKEMLLMFDMSNYLEKQYSVLFIQYNKNAVSPDEKNLKNYLISVKI